MVLQVFNTLNSQKETFTPISGNRVLMYACGPTVYDLSHLGHARMTIVWDVAQRYLRFSGYDVTYVRNITDVDDKIIEKAKELGVTPEKVARQFTYTFWHDMHRLNNEPPDYEPRCTEFIEPMIAFIQGLIDAGHAYASEGDVYFDVPSFKEYGELGKKTLEDLISGAREQVRSQEDLSARKKSPVDFALWKGAAEGEIGWSSPWGRGRPGWHLECSTMIKHVLGETIDIHSGGEDLVFPHHENEIAQSRCLHGKPLARYWLHNSFVNVSSEKMSKSLGNFSTIDSLLETYTGDTIRLFVLQTHYRHPIDFTPESLDAAHNAMSRLLKAVSHDNTDINGSTDSLLPVEDEVTGKFAADFKESMDNDLNTAQAISHLFGLADRISQTEDASTKSGYARVLRLYGNVLGLTFDDTRKTLDTRTGEGVLDLVLDIRQSARANKDFKTSDLIRDRLVDLGINVMDGGGGKSSWEKA
ncbi:MAG: cysteine--tRNA ligase [Cyanobacteria bacterium HKST-UBA02]|nr:cysteine--tRNA ligase [Cyanobacteria bacterium HKST-UBA02]